MFGLGQKKAPPLVGAKEKLIAAQAARIRKTLAQAKAMGIGKEGRSASQAVPVTLIFVLSVLFAAVLTETGALGRLGWHISSNPNLNRLLLGSGIPDVTGDPDMDKLIVLFSRGGLIFVATGIFPFFGFILAKALDRKITPYTATWAMGIVLPLLYFFFSESFGGLMDALSEMIG
jgi:hypothetical protein